MSNYPKWRYVADGEFPKDSLEEECFVEDEFGHCFTATYCRTLITSVNDNFEVTSSKKNVFLSNETGGTLPNKIIRWVPLKDIVIVTEVKEDISND